MHTRRLPRAFSSFRLHPTALSLASAALTSVSLVACTQMPGGLEEPGELGHATPVANPSDSTPAGEVVDGALSGMNILDDVAVLRAGGDAASTVLTVLPTIELASGGALGSDSPQAKEITIDAHCGEPSVGYTPAGGSSDENGGAKASTLVIACDDGIHLIDAAAGTDTRLDTGDKTYTTAALTTDGVLTAGNNQSLEVDVYRDFTADRGGELGQASTFKIDRAPDQLVATSSYPGNIAAINRSETAIQQLNLEKGTRGAALRVGTGVGQAVGATGVARDVIFATDTEGDHLNVYTMSPIVMLHQVAPVDDSPYALAWDAKRQLVWVASTGTNAVQGFDISSGVPEEVARLDSIPDVAQLGVDTQGNLFAASATQLQKVSAQAVDAAKKS